MSYTAGRLIKCSYYVTGGVAVVKWQGRARQRQARAGGAHARSVRSLEGSRGSRESGRGRGRAAVGARRLAVQCVAPRPTRGVRVARGVALT